MKAFVSYSVNAKDELVIVLLASKLRDKKLYITSGNLFYSDHRLDFITQSRIKEANLFLGVITANGQQNANVIQEWKFAIQNRIPNLLLVENNAGIVLQEGNVVMFDRYNPAPAIEYINNHMLPQKTQIEEAMPWLLGGAALLAAISLLSNQK